MRIPVCFFTKRIDFVRIPVRFFTKRIDFVKIPVRFFAKRIDFVKILVWILGIPRAYAVPWSVDIGLTAQFILADNERVK